MQHRTVTLDDGASTQMTQWGDAGPVLLCVHGLTSSRLGWRRFAEHYADRYRVFAYDQRGHGDAYAHTADMRIERVIRDFHNVVAAIGEPVEASIGHSWGGAVVIAGSPSADVRKTIAVDPVLRQIASSWYDEYLEELQPVFARSGPERDAYVRDEYGDAHPFDREGKVHAMHAMVPEGLMNVREQNPPERWSLAEHISTFPLPLLVALADPQESIVVPEDFRALETVRNPKVQVEVFTGQGHSLHRTAFEAFTAAVERFLETSDALV